MDRRLFARAGLGLLTVFATSRATAGSDKPHRLALQISAADRKVQALALGNARNFAAHYKRKGEPFAIAIVVFGPGFSMVRDDMSMMKGEVEQISKDLGGSIGIEACRNTRNALAESEGKTPEQIPLLPSVKETPSGVVRLAELHQQGWSYVAP